VCLPCEFGANPSSGSPDISYPNKKQTDGARNRTFNSLLRAVIRLRSQIRNKAIVDYTSPALCTPVMRPIVSMPEEDRATDIRNMHKNGKDRARGSGDTLADR